ncbi:hypothetical protein [Celeribacter indicus]|uniref:Uncharacterized protein n=1 Tax=Celeribacter indicus TaxID=1208324 RepID=A0A0B5DZ28_9RHOB|nr:hypothetical protein [Celeribacter indicus]AJE48658.1 hypothetical protein P73_3943 [Celeribacter indicus]SDX35091.1 hypothetical protein SAMN05443573_12322 [Celeribacter indicus]
MFTFLLDLATEKGRSIHAYAAAAKAAYAQALKEPDHAAAFYYLATSAENFVDRHERQPLSSEEFEQTFMAFQADIHALEKTAEAPEGTRLSVLNEIVASRIERTG